MNFTNHLRYSCNVVIAATDEAYQRFPGILTENANTLELRSSLAKIGIRS
jgi:hypothetical protein